ncbi:MlaD family protein [Pseudonocardia sp. RS010]|uniref:MlaD family protein n=1 Tax=Pseudonocardia sp. RS010 TaxID=3385979 RepID=UPI0039A165CB
MARIEMRRAHTARVVGLVMLGAVAVVLYLATTVHEGLPGATVTAVKVAFTDIDSLEVGDQVRENSVRVGRVSDIELVGDQAVATLELEGERDVYRDARAAVWDLSSLGTKFVELYPGSAPSGALGEDVLPAGQNVDSADLYKVLDVLDPPTREATTSAIRELGGGVAGHSQDLHDLLASGADLLTDTGTIAGTLSDPQAGLVDTLRATDRLAARFAGRDQQIADLVGQTADTFDAIAVDGSKPLHDTLETLPGTLDQARAAFAALDAPLADTQSAMTVVRPGAEALGTATPDLRGVLTEGPRPLDKVPGVAEAAEPAVEDLTATFADARPLAPKLTEAIRDVRSLVGDLSPYAVETGQFFARGHNFVGDEVAPGIHYARLGVAPGAGSALGAVTEGDITGRNLYPAPFEAQNDRYAGPLGGGR